MLGDFVLKKGTTPNPEDVGLWTSTVWRDTGELLQRKKRQQAEQYRQVCYEKRLSWDRERRGNFEFFGERGEVKWKLISVE